MAKQERWQLFQMLQNSNKCILIFEVSLADRSDSQVIIILRKLFSYISYSLYFLILLLRKLLFSYLQYYFNTIILIINCCSENQQLLASIFSLNSWKNQCDVGWWAYAPKSQKSHNIYYLKIFFSLNPKAYTQGPCKI